MFFQRYVADDFNKHQDLLLKKINVDDLQALLQTVDKDLHVVSSIASFKEVPTRYIATHNPNHLLIRGASINKSERARKYNSIKCWLDDDGFPVIADIKALRLEYPGLDMMSDLQLALFTYAVHYPHDEANALFRFDGSEDYIKLFVDGYKEWGVADDFDQPTVSMSKLQYLIKQGRKEGYNEWA